MSGKRNLAGRLQTNRNLSSAGKNRAYSGMEVRLVKTTSTIGPREESESEEITGGTGTAVITGINTLYEVTDRTSTITVVNMSQTLVPSGKLIYVARVKSQWHFLGTEGGGGGGQEILQFKTTTAISAGNPTDGTSGNGSANYWSFNGTSWGIDSSTLYDIVNPWGYAVSQDIMITAYQDINHSDKYVLIQAECEEDDGGTDPPADPLGYCMDDTTGAVTENVLQSECTGTWSADAFTLGCCDVSGTEHPNVAEDWCTTQSGSFTAGACPPDFDPCPENAKFTLTSLSLSDPTSGSCATTPWSATGGSNLGLGYQTGCTKRFYANATIASSENPPASSGVCDADVVYRAGTNDWLITGEVRYYNNTVGGNWTVPFTGTAPHTGTDCASTTLNTTITGTSGGDYSQSCDSTDGTVLTGTIVLQMVCN